MESLILLFVYTTSTSLHILALKTPIQKEQDLNMNLLGITFLLQGQHQSDRLMVTQSLHPRT